MNNSKRLAADGLLTAVLLVLQVALSYLPNIELVSLSVILYTLVLGKRVIPILLAFSLLEGLLYGFGIWWISYLYIWPILAGCTWMLKKFHSPDWGYWFLSCGFGLCFGLLCSIPYLAGGLGAALAWWIAGIPFDLLHGLGNLAVASVLFHPFKRILSYCLR